MADDNAGKGPGKHLHVIPLENTANPAARGERRQRGRANPGLGAASQGPRRAGMEMLGIIPQGSNVQGGSGLWDGLTVAPRWLRVFLAWGWGWAQTLPFPWNS